MLLATSILAAPAWAAQEPKAVKQDPRIQVVPYDENNPVKLHLVAGAHRRHRGHRQGENHRRLPVGRSASRRRAFPGHFVFLKPIMEMPAQPIFIKTVRLDGTGDRLYPFMLDAYDPDPPAGLPRANGQVATVSTGSAQAGDAADEARPYTVRFVYPADEAKARTAAATEAARHRAARRDVKLGRGAPAGTAAGGDQRRLSGARHGRGARRARPGCHLGRWAEHLLPLRRQPPPAGALRADAGRRGGAWSTTRCGIAR